MAASKKIILGILPSLGGSIKSQRVDRREGLFLGYYIPKYLQNFDEVRYFSYAKAEEPKETHLAGFHIFSNQLGLQRFLYALVIPFFYRNQIKACNLFRVMHLNGAIPAIIIKKLYGIPFVATYGYNYAKFAEIEGHRWKAKVLRMMIPFFLKNAKAIIVTTADLKKEVENYIGKLGKIELVPNGVDAAKFAPEKNTASKQELFSLFRLLSIGRLEKQKNLFFLLDVIARLKDKRSIKLVVIGRGSLESELKEKVNRENLPVHFISHVAYDSIREYHRESDCFISTSLAEGHPKALIEAMSSGLACVVSDCAGNRTLIKDGRNGFLLKTEEIDLWVDRLSELSNNPALCMGAGRQAREHIIQNFDIHHTLDKELKLLLSVANQPERTMEVAC